MHTPHYFFLVGGPDCQVCGLARDEGAHLPDDDTVSPQPEPPRTFTRAHDYVSTACQHRHHDICRFMCKYCSATCLCVCHRWVVPVESV